MVSGVSFGCDNVVSQKPVLGTLWYQFSFVTLSCSQSKNGSWDTLAPLEISLRNGMYICNKRHS